MIYLYYTKEEVESQVLLDKILVRAFGYSADDLQRNEYGKPYLKGNPVYFNATNTRGFSALAVADSEIGIDCEPLGRKERSFLEAFVAKEAYVKRLGDSIFRTYKTLTYQDGGILKNGIVADRPQLFTIDEFLIGVSCEDGPIRTINLDKENVLL